MQTTKKGLKAKIEAYNQLAPAINGWAAKTVELLQSWKGKKVVKKDGTLVKRLQDQLDKIKPNDKDITFYTRNAITNLVLEGKITYYVPGFNRTYYLTLYIHVAAINDYGVLTDIFEPLYYSLASEEGIMKTREKLIEFCRQAELDYIKIKGDIPYSFIEDMPELRTNVYKF